MSDDHLRNQITTSTKIDIGTNEDQVTSKFTEEIAIDILTLNNLHPLEIKVELNDGYCDKYWIDSQS